MQAGCEGGGHWLSQRLNGAFTVSFTRTEALTGAAFTAVLDVTGWSEVGGGGGNSLADAVAGMQTMAAPIINADAAKAERVTRTSTDIVFLDRLFGAAESCLREL